MRFCSPGIIKIRLVPADNLVRREFRRTRLFVGTGIFKRISTLIMHKLMIERVKSRWACESGYRNILVLAFPLILSTSAWSVQHFVDRMFLTWYSPETIAAAMPAGILNFALMTVFIGTAGYVSTFIAQYFGANQHDRIGPVLWQGIYISVIAGVGFLALIPYSGSLFRFIGHDPIIQRYETIYFRVLCYGAVPAIASSALSGFFSGLGKTWPIMWVNVLATVVNLVLDYTMIFGKWGFAERGIQGAAIATVIATYVSCGVFMLLLSRRAFDEQYHTRRGWRLDLGLLRRIWKFGFPNGVQFFLDMIGFTAFLLFMGRLGTVSLAATNIAFNINSLAFMPMLGFGIAVSVLVAQHLGENKPELAERSVYSGFHITFLYMGSIALCYFFLPKLFLWPYSLQSDAAAFEPIRQLTTVLLRFVAVYSLFDALTIIFASAVKGAGDTRFAMYAILLISGAVFTLPSYLALIVLKQNVYVGWVIASTYAIVMGLTFFFRFLQGKWKTMRVIEEVPPFIPPLLSENPVVEYEI
ncbi:MATE efflux family protein [Candidatus Vecturithrix granuli]|uniref:Multidrug-efflux transporter n=1 Tax=Vecturithrix granuli TaxID=1499967 RepID=A0A081C3D9_VECG1|nr:MATE efflux family protein [Candidatus Vecturithrix granuli]